MTCDGAEGRALWNSLVKNKDGTVDFKEFLRVFASRPNTVDGVQDNLTLFSLFSLSLSLSFSGSLTYSTHTHTHNRSLQEADRGSLFHAVQDPP